MVETIALVLSIIAITAITSLIPLILWMKSNHNDVNDLVQKQLQVLTETTDHLLTQPQQTPMEERLQAVEGKMTALQMRSR
jgi:short subunit fatty acids transporter